MEGTVNPRLEEGGRRPLRWTSVPWLALGTGLIVACAASVVGCAPDPEAKPPGEPACFGEGDWELSYPERAGEACGDSSAWIKDCEGRCVKLSHRVGDGHCDPSFFCPALELDGGDCLPDPGAICDFGYGLEGFVTCDGDCVLDAWRIGDGVCDEDLFCEGFLADADDCFEGTPGDPCVDSWGYPGTYDCYSDCYVPETQSEGECDFKRECEALGYDDGDCPVTKKGPPGEPCVGYYGDQGIYDCDGDCYVISDEFPFEADGCSEWLNCAATNHDNGECETGPAGGSCSLPAYGDTGEPIDDVPGLWSCEGLCVDPCLVGNDFCNPSLNCEGLDFDGGDCGP